jgi:hypothetical protein
MFNRLVCGLGAIVTASLSLTASATVVVDAANDLINGFSAATNPDLDVLSTEVLYNNVTNQFTLNSTVAGNIGTTATASYVWGINRGAGTAGFGANGFTNILFDRVVRLVPGGTSQIAGGGLPAINLPVGAVVFSGATMTATFDASLLPNNGFTFANYTYNLWPRVAAPTGFAGIPDFSPDNTNAPVSVIPAPSALGIIAAGGLVVGRRRR